MPSKQAQAAQLGRLENPGWGRGVDGVVIRCSARTLSFSGYSVKKNYLACWCDHTHLIVCRRITAFLCMACCRNGACACTFAQEDAPAVAACRQSVYFLFLMEGPDGPVLRQRQGFVHHREIFSQLPSEARKQCKMQDGTAFTPADTSCMCRRPEL